MRRSLISALIAIAFASAAQAQTKVTLQTDWSPYGMHGPLFLAAEKGWYRDAGLEVTILDGKGSATTIQQVAAGQIDVAFAQLATMAAAVDKGMPVISVACFVRAGDNGLAVPAGGPIKTAKDLVGKRIVYASGSSSASLMDAYFTAAGIRREDMTLVGVDNSALPSTYVAGGVDAAIATIAYLMPIIGDKRPSAPLFYADAGLRVPSFGLVVRKEDVGARADLVKRFVAATVRAFDYTREGHVDEAVAAIIAGRPNDRLDPKVMTAQLEGYLKLLDTPATKGKGIGFQAESDWKQAIAALQGAGMIKRETAPDAYFTNAFLAN